MNTSHQSSAAFHTGRSNVVELEARDPTFASSKVRVPQPSSFWVTKLNDKFNELTTLPFGWDGYKGVPVSFTCAQFAAHLLERLYVTGVPAPHLVPGSDGTIQIEWHRNQFDVEIDILAPYEVTAIRRNLRNGEVNEERLEMDFTVLSEWMTGLKISDELEMNAAA